MNLEQWQQIGGRMVGLFPAAPLAPETFAAYFDEIGGFDADIVESAIRRHSHVSKWFPAVSEILALVRPEQAVRDEWQRSPDFTGFASLPEARKLALLEEGLEASRDVEGVRPKSEPEPDVPAAPEVHRLLTDGSDA